MHRRRLLLFCVVLMLGLCPLLTAASTIAMTVTGTLGPVLSGSDPLGGNGQSGTINVSVSESLTPTKRTSTSVTYTLPVGAITITIGGTTYSTPNTTTMKITVPASGPDIISLTTSVTYLGIKGTVTGTAALAAGSFSKAVFAHPVPFSPSTQTLTSATTAGGPGSQVKYTVFGGTTVLGIAGSASNTAMQRTR